MGELRRKRLVAWLVLQLMLDFAFVTAAPMIIPGTSQRAQRLASQDGVSEPATEANTIIVDIVQNQDRQDVLNMETENSPATASGSKIDPDPQTAEGAEEEVSVDDTADNDEDTGEEESEDIQRIMVEQVQPRVARQHELMTDEVYSEAKVILKYQALFNEKLLQRNGGQWSESQHFENLQKSAMATCGKEIWEDLKAIINVFDVEVESDLLEMLSVVALIQTTGRCSAVAEQLARDVVSIAENDADIREVEDTEPQMDRADDPCLTVKECRETNVPVVRKILGHHRSLLSLYDVAAAAVFSVSDSGSELVRALADDVLSDFNLSRNSTNEAVFKVTIGTNFTRTLRSRDNTGNDTELASVENEISARSELVLDTNRGHLIVRHRRDDCNNLGEDIANSVIGGIPFVGVLYGLVSAIVWEGRGCQEKAMGRYIGSPIGFAMDFTPWGRIFRFL